MARPAVKTKINLWGTCKFWQVGCVTFALTTPTANAHVYQAALTKLKDQGKPWPRRSLCCPRPSTWPDPGAASAGAGLGRAGLSQAMQSREQSQTSAQEGLTLLILDMPTRSPQHPDKQRIPLLAISGFFLSVYRLLESDLQNRRARIPLKCHAFPKPARLQLPLLVLLEAGSSIILLVSRFGLQTHGAADVCRQCGQRSSTFFGFGSCP